MTATEKATMSDLDEELDDFIISSREILEFAAQMEVTDSLFAESLRRLVAKFEQIVRERDKRDFALIEQMAEEECNRLIKKHEGIEE